MAIIVVFLKLLILTIFCNYINIENNRLVVIIIFAIDRIFKFETRKLTINDTLILTFLILT